MAPCALQNARASCVFAATESALPEHFRASCLAAGCAGVGHRARSVGFLPGNEPLVGSSEAAIAGRKGMLVPQAGVHGASVAIGHHRRTTWAVKFMRLELATFMRLSTAASILPTTMLCSAICKHSCDRHWSSMTMVANPIPLAAGAHGSFLNAPSPGACAANRRVGAIVVRWC